jgi:formylglycine-generating enzyme required for sulfatase activity
MNAVQFSDAVEFCRLLSEQEGLTEQVFSAQQDGSWQVDVSRLGYRLPTEAEWECACRAGTTTARFFGSHETRLPESYRGIKSDGSYEVASYMPNQWGLFDVYGNLFEWTLGKLGPLKAATDPSLFLTTHYPPGVIRGGNYRSDESIIRSAARTPMIVDNADGPLVLGIGLRIAATLQNDDTMEVLGRNP